MNKSPDFQLALTVDASGLSCPMPTLRAKQGLLKIESGDLLELLSTDPATQHDIPAFCQQQRLSLEHQEAVNDSLWRFIIRK